VALHSDYYWESSEFLFEKRFTYGKYLKYSYRVTNMYKNIILQDIEMTLYNRLKTYFNVNTGLIRAFSIRHKRPFMLPALIKPKLFFFSYLYNDFLCESPEANRTINLRTSTGFYEPVNPRVFLTVFNKTVFYELFVASALILCLRPSFIRMHRPKWRVTPGILNSWPLGLLAKTYRRKASIRGLIKAAQSKTLRRLSKKEVVNNFKRNKRKIINRLKCLSVERKAKRKLKRLSAEKAAKRTSPAVVRRRADTLKTFLKPLAIKANARIRGSRGFIKFTKVALRVFGKSIKQFRRLRKAYTRKKRGFYAPRRRFLKRGLPKIRYCFRKKAQAKLLRKPRERMHRAYKYNRKLSLARQFVMAKVIAKRKKWLAKGQINKQRHRFIKAARKFLRSYLSYQKRRHKKLFKAYYRVKRRYRFKAMLNSYRVFSATQRRKLAKKRAKRRIYLVIRKRLHLRKAQKQQVRLFRLPLRKRQKAYKKLFKRKDPFMAPKLVQRGVIIRFRKMVKKKFSGKRP